MRSNGSPQPTHAHPLLQAAVWLARLAARGARRNDCEIEHAGCHRASVKSLRMEVLLLLWDEFDDLVGACRHVAKSAAEEVATVSAPLIAGASAVLGVWLVIPV